MIENPKELRWIRILLIIITIPVIVLILKTLKVIFIPLIFAIFLSFVFAPLTGYLRRQKVHIYVIMLTMLVIILLFFIGTTLLLTTATSNLISGFPNYQQRLLIIVQDSMDLFKNFSARMDFMLSNISNFSITKMLEPESFSISKALSGIMTTTLGISWNFFLIVVFLLFLIADGGQMNLRLNKVMNETHRKRASSTIGNIQKQIQRYLLTKTVISLLTAIVGMILMLLYGVDFVLICGILLFVLNFIPNIGSIIASSVPILICLLQSGFDFRFLSFTVLIVATQMLFGNIIEPRVQGNRLNLSPITVLISLIFWGWVWGFIGMIMAVPLTSALNIILIQIDENNLISAVISGEAKESRNN